MKKEIDMSIFLEDHRRYADLINVSGKIKKRKVRAEDVKDYDAKLSSRIEHRSKQVYFSKQRDMVRKIIFGINFIISEIELQETVDYSYPLRDMGYTFGEYDQQIRVIRKENKQRSDLSSGEYLYGYNKDDKLCPTIIFLLYFGVEEWNGPTCIHDMLDFTDVPEELVSLVQNHRIHLIDIHRMHEKEFELFETDIGKVFRLIKHSESKEDLKKIVEHDPYYSNMDRDAYMVSINYMQAKELLRYEKAEKEGGVYDMCTGIKEWLKDEREEGREEGLEEGKVCLLIDLVNDNVINITEAAKRLKISEEDFQKILKERKDTGILL